MLLRASGWRSTLLAPVGTFSYRPLSTAVPFTFHMERTRSLAELAGDLGARFVHQGLAQVDASRQRVLTHDGDFLPYDALLIAVGARCARPPSPGVMWSRGEGVAVLTRSSASSRRGPSAASRSWSPACGLADGRL